MITKRIIVLGLCLGLYMPLVHAPDISEIKKDKEVVVKIFPKVHHVEMVEVLPAEIETPYLSVNIKRVYVAKCNISNPFKEIAPCCNGPTAI